jgi:molecular chaperone GrpE
MSKKKLNKLKQNDNIKAPTNHTNELNSSDSPNQSNSTVINFGTPKVVSRDFVEEHNRMPSADSETIIPDQINNEPGSQPNLNTAQQEILQIELEQTKIQLLSAQAEAIDWRNKALRAVADMENSKRQQELETAQNKKNIRKNIAKPVLDFLKNQFMVLTYLKDIQDETALKSLETLKVSFQKVVNDLKIQGIEVVIPVVGEEYNAQYMHGLNTPNNEENTTIAAVVSLGLKVDSQLIEPAMVMFH